ncbi:E3 ubiquitin-protein ligase AIP2 [Olea europaea var. sylvestris]|uniref:RING-type E3 ubiquitin transferase n=1 Tax=Olea europaea subsp. europaea TaxID=158383 RepID=A0A8S0UZQ8_OLEEU|nr:E3 ubiquitin-protein ligase AIP2 [Olea europaea var. sylvestris]CAA3024028.1 E3 ubiquitin- ligase AIP2 [Olea europaea subsp. europaea]
MATSENELTKRLEELQKQLAKKQMFEGSVSTIRSLLQQHYSSASPSLQQLFYSVICRVATILKTRYTSPGFWNAGLTLFQVAERLVSNTSERKHLQSCMTQAREQLGEVQNLSEDLRPSQNRRGYLFEGHLTVDPEPPQPDWLVQENLLTATATLLRGESSGGEAGTGNTLEGAANLIEELVSRLDDIVPEILDNDAAVPRVPPASKEVVAKLPVTSVTEAVLAKLGEDAVCSICQETLVVNDKMQELPCEHMFHPPCLKPWLDVHNACPICRHELLTDDHAYESWKEREKEAEEERKGAANAVRGGEYMYV